VRALALPLVLILPLACAPARPPRSQPEAPSTPEQVRVPAGRFMMGSDDPSLVPPAWALEERKSEGPVHEVHISRDFWIDTYEVTNAAFARFVGDRGYQRPELWSEEGRRWLSAQDLAALPVRCGDERPTHPRVCVTWYEADAYARWRGGALPSEAEWEYAARGPKSSTYPWGDRFEGERANLEGSPALRPVGSYPSGVSWVGAHDMTGNAMEWVEDWYSTTYYRSRVRDDPRGPATGTQKVEKGGWWGAPAYAGRSAYRHFEDPPTYQDHHIGFRVVRH
jgi:formylglycine-generating enzyme required for sulfatase activity